MPFCYNCGAKLKDIAKFCPNCGVKIITKKEESSEIVDVENEENNNSADVNNRENSTENNIKENNTNNGGVFSNIISTINNTISNNKTNTNSGCISSNQPSISNTDNNSNNNNYANNNITNNSNYYNDLYKKNFESENVYSTRERFAGQVLKCPSCGEHISHSTVICPACRCRLTGQEVAGSVQKFNEQLMLIESQRQENGLKQAFGFSANPTDIKILSLIEGYVIPSSVDDILDFMFLASTNIDVELSRKKAFKRRDKNLLMVSNPMYVPVKISNAWVKKMEMAYKKAKSLFPNEPEFIKIENIYVDKMTELGFIKKR